MIYADGRCQVGRDGDVVAFDDIVEGSARADCRRVHPMGHGSISTASDGCCRQRGNGSSSRRICSRKRKTFLPVCGGARAAWPSALRALDAFEKQPCADNLEILQWAYAQTPKQMRIELNKENVIRAYLGLPRVFDFIDYCPYAGPGRSRARSLFGAPSEKAKHTSMRRSVDLSALRRRQIKCALGKDRGARPILSDNAHFAARGGIDSAFSKRTRLKQPWDGRRPSQTLALPAVPAYLQCPDFGGGRGGRQRPAFARDFGGNGQTRLLRNPRRRQDRQRSRVEVGVPQGGDDLPSRPQSRRQAGGSPLQGTQRGLSAPF